MKTLYVRLPSADEMNLKWSPSNPGNEWYELQREPIPGERVRIINGAAEIYASDKTSDELSAEASCAQRKARLAAYAIQQELDIMRHAFERVRGFAERFGITISGLEEWDEYAANIEKIVGE